jgi:hypothetical protein
MEAAAEKTRLDAQIAREALAAEAAAQNARVASQASADGQRMLAEAYAEGEKRRVEIYSNAPDKAAVGIALQALASKIENIQHLNITPDLLGSSLQQLLRDNAGK